MSYVFTDNVDGLISFSNTQTGKVFYRWKIEIDEKQSSAKVFLNLPDIKSDDFDIRLFSSVFAISRRIFDGPAYKEKDSNLSAFTALEKLGLVYEK